MMGETVGETTPSGGNVSAEVKAQLAKPWLKIVGFSVLGLVLVAGLVWAGIQLGHSSRPRVSTWPIGCQSDADCILVLEREGCCRCPLAANKQALIGNRNLMEYLPGETGRAQVELPECRNIQCSPCPWWSKAVCESGLCKGKSEKAVSSPDLPGDFNIYFSFGVGGKNIFDTNNNLYVKDMICDPPLKFVVTLNQDEKEKIYKAVEENSFFDLKENIFPSLVGVKCEPSFILALQVIANQKTKTVKWECGYPGNDPDYLKLKNISDIIQSVISQKEKEMAIPEPKCGYL